MPQQNGVLVVTGGGRGIGAATALLGAERGYAIVVNYTSNVAAAEQICASIHAKGGEAVAVRGDVASPEDVEHIFAAADRLGTLTGLVNNAGMIFPGARLDEMDAARINRSLAVNVTGSFLCAAAAVRRMSTKHGGKGGGIVNVGSAASKLGGSGVNLDYAAAKGAIDTFTVGLALEVALEGIRVNSVRPGVIDTEIHASAGDPDRVARMVPSVPVQRAGTADDVARAILWLLSDEASYTTGTTVTVSGGRAILP
ncbi:MAG: SDR family oxidoreductase [Hyphomicrobiales bacterium]|nr:MAG: SDR family oxidoreductase [Hyphomicrobiales bacterium]